MLIVNRAIRNPKIIKRPNHIINNFHKLKKNTQKYLFVVRVLLPNIIRLINIILEKKFHLEYGIKQNTEKSVNRYIN